jgi:hypothetical protein
LPWFLLCFPRTTSSIYRHRAATGRNLQFNPYLNLVRCAKFVEDVDVAVTVLIYNREVLGSNFVVIDVFRGFSPSLQTDITLNMEEMQFNFIDNVYCRVHGDVLDL